VVERHMYYVRQLKNKNFKMEEQLSVKSFLFNKKKKKNGNSKKKKELRKITNSIVVQVTLLAFSNYRKMNIASARTLYCLRTIGSS